MLSGAGWAGGGDDAAASAYVGCGVVAGCAGLVYGGCAAVSGGAPVYSGGAVFCTPGAEAAAGAACCCAYSSFDRRTLRGLLPSLGPIIPLAYIISMRRPALL